MLNYFFKQTSTIIYFVTWGLSLIAYSLAYLIDPSIFTYAIQNGVNWIDSILYLLFCVSMLGLGLFWGSLYSYNKSRSKRLFNQDQLFFLKRKHNFSGFKVNKLFLYVISISVLISGYLLFKSSGFTGDLQSQREVHMESLGESGGLKLYLYQYSSAISIFYISLLPWSKNTGLVNRLLPLIIIASGHFIASLSTGSRAQIFVLFVLPLLTSTLLRRVHYYRSKVKLFRNYPVNHTIKFNKKDNILIKKLINNLLFVIFLFLAIGTVIFSLLYWQYLRSSSMFEGGSIGYMRRYLSYYLFLRNYFDLSDNVLLPIAFIIKNPLDYLSNAWQYFPYFYESYNYPPVFGGYQINIISSKLVDPGEWLEWKRQVENVYMSYNFDVVNVWGSFVREYVIDFGRIITPLACFFSGKFISLCEINFLSNKIWFCLYVCSLMWLSFTPFYSILVIRSFQICFLFMLLSLIVKKIVKKNYNFNKYAGKSI